MRSFFCPRLIRLCSRPSSPLIEYEGSPAAAVVGHVYVNTLVLLRAPLTSLQNRRGHEGRRRAVFVAQRSEQVSHAVQRRERSRDGHLPVVRGRRGSGSALPRGHGWLERDISGQHLRERYVDFESDADWHSCHTSGFDWGSLKEDSVVVDVGGSMGKVTYMILKEYPKLQYIVQDLEKVVKSDAPKVRRAIPRLSYPR